MTCEEFEELSGAYALGAVTSAERQAAEAHLAGCAKCTRLFQELHGVVTLLPLSVPQVNPPPGLKARIMAAIRQEAGGIPTQRAGARRSLQDRQRSHPGRRRWNLSVLVAAAVLLFSLLGTMIGWNISLNHQVTLLEQQLAQAKGSPPPSGVTTYTIVGVKSASGATGQLIYFAKQKITVLIMHGLPQLEGGRVYQGWLLHLKENNITGVISIGLLNIQPGGTATLSYSGNVTTYNGAAISMEPGPYATPKAPKGEVIAEGVFSHTPLGLK